MITAQKMSAETGSSSYSGLSNGWASYQDTTYSEASPLSVTGNSTYINLPNNAGIILDDYMPSDITALYDGSIITGIEGETRLLTISFAIKPTTASVTSITTVPDIGGVVGEIDAYAESKSFAKGNNVEQRYLASYGAFTLDTWEANGATMMIKSDGACEIYDIRYLITTLTRV